MENGPFIDDFPIKTSIYKGFSMAMLNNQRVYIYYRYVCMYIYLYVRQIQWEQTWWPPDLNGLIFQKTHENQKALSLQANFLLNYF